MEVKRPPWLSNNHPLFSLGLDLPVSRAAILGLLPCTAHYCSHPYLQLNCETALDQNSSVDEPGMQRCFSSIPKAAPWAWVGWHSCLAALLQSDPQPGAFTGAPAAAVGRIRAAVPLQPWQGCKVAEAAVFKHCICGQPHSMRSLKGTHIAGAEKLGVLKLLSIKSHW